MYFEKTKRIHPENLPECSGCGKTPQRTDGCSREPWAASPDFTWCCGTELTVSLETELGLGPQETWLHLNLGEQSTL